MTKSTTSTTFTNRRTSNTKHLNSEIPFSDLNLNKVPSRTQQIINDEHNLHQPNDSNISTPHEDTDTAQLAHAVSASESWNDPGNKFRLGAAFFSFFVTGLNDASFGALLPYLQSHYGLTYITVSLVFLFPFVGYTAAAFVNATVHAKFGQRGIALITPLCHIASYICLSLHAPWGVVVTFATVGGFGIGLIDGAWSAWTGHMARGNMIEGILHGFYALGCTFSPLIATNLVTQAALPWYTFYYIMLGLAVVELVACVTAFWSRTGLHYKLAHPSSGGSRTKEALRNKVTWLCSAFFLVYVGAEVALGGWIVSFMLDVRKASPYASGVSATGFWAGMTLGRAGLGVVTELLSQRVGEKICVSVYLAAAIALQLVFWLVPNFTVSAVSVAFLGIFLGPIFPSGIILATKLLPSHIHISSIGFSTALGGTGGAFGPFVVGAIAQAKGVQVLQPIILALLGVLAAVWFMFPRVQKRNE